jgi:septal ring factor EnvC (AmiA/AmiB activator)
MRDLNGATKNLNDLNTALDEDIDTGEYEALAKHLKSVAKESKDLSKDLAYNEKAAKKVSEAILRFDNAIQDVNDNYEDWAHTLKSGSLQD